MKAHFDQVALDAQKLKSDGEVRLFVVSSVRLLLHQAVFSLLEWACKQPSRENTYLPSDLFPGLLVPADGTLVDSLESLVIYCEQVGWTGISRALFAPIPDEAECKVICGDSDATTAGLLRGLVQLRNDGAEGHGLVGDYQRGAELDCLQQITARLGPVLPSSKPDGQLVVGPDGKTVALQFLRLFDTKPALIRRIKVVGRNKLRVDVQFIHAEQGRRKARFETENYFSALNTASAPKLEQWSNSWSPLCYLPDRTTESFKGRKEEQVSLTEWMNDEESRTCLVFGDGGVGKTTLVLEFMHRLLEEDPDIQCEWKPKVVSFYTAKKWRWGLDGVELISAGQPHLLGLLAHLHLLLLSRLPSQDFYRLEVAQAAVRLQQLMASEADIKRSEHLIIVDNSETLISSAHDIEILGKELKEIGRRIGRVIITSRRREVIEAEPIAVAPLKPSEAVALLKERAVALGLKVVQRATDDNLRSLLVDLGCRPLVLEAFLQALTDPTTATLESAKKRVATMLRRDLGEFLFADAWVRYAAAMKHLLLLMTNVADVHDARQLTICCEIANVSLQSAEEALEESSGIASIVRMNNGIEVSFSPNFLKFAKDKVVAVSGVNRPTSDEISQARQQYSRFVQAVQSFTGDRIPSAFRTPLAKAAYAARKDGRKEEALRLYQQAILADSSNGWLFDRFAYFLFRDIRDNNAALIQTKRATELLPDEGEVWFTRGIVESRLGDFRQCEASLGKAESLGVDRVRCAVQRAWGYLKAFPAMLNLASQQIDFLRQSLATAPRSDRNWIETESLMSRLEYLARKGRNVRGRPE